MKNKKPYLTALYITLGLTVLLLFLNFIGIFDFLELKTYDFRFKIRALAEQSPRPRPDISIIAIDNESLAEIGKWPWPRKEFAKLIEILKKQGVKKTVFDVIMSEEDEDDEILKSVMVKSKNIILPYTLEYSGNKLTRVSYPTKTLSRGLINQIPTTLGFINIPIDKDGYLRRARLSVSDNKKTYYSIAVLMSDVDSQFLKAYPEILINYTNKQFNKIPFHYVIKGDFPDGIFKNSVVLVGKTYPDCKDIFSTPIGSIYGVEVHANIINTLLNRTLVHKSALWQDILILFFLILFTCLFSCRFSLLKTLAFTGIEIIFLLFIGLYLFIAKSYFILFSMSFAGIILAYIGTLGVKIKTETFEKKRIRTFFSRYIAPEVVDVILTNEPKLGGERREITVLFSDIRDFTKLSSELKPEGTLSFLNTYFTEMIKILFEERGTWNKFMGDGLMAIYGAPIAFDDHAERAVISAIKMIEKVKQLNKDCGKDFPVPIKIGIGIHTGRAIVGNIGSSNRMEYTAVGKTVNLASRLEELTKEIPSASGEGGDILISEETYKRVKDSVLTEFAGEHKIRGIEESVRVYQVLKMTKSE